MILYCLFFFKQKTAYEMRISDWSSDVCSSDLAATIGTMAIPEMIKRGYKPHFAYGIVAAGGTLGILIPPSTPMIIYSGVTDESTGALFMGGVIPGRPETRRDGKACVRTCTYMWPPTH